MTTLGLIISATTSGAGKTTITTGLIRALADCGRAPAAFKVGPDFIDPSYLTAAAGRPANTLDVFMSGEDLIAPLYRAGAVEADVAVIEGVAGLFDGERLDSDRASTAHVAKLLGLPVVAAALPVVAAALPVYAFKLDIRNSVFLRSLRQESKCMFAPLGAPPHFLEAASMIAGIMR